MTLAYLSAVTFVAGPSRGKAKKGKKVVANPLPEVRINPFETEAERKEKAARKALALKNFLEYRDNHKLELKKAYTEDDVDEYLFNPYVGGGEPISCKQFRGSLNFPEDEPIVVCQDNDNRTMSPTRINAKKLHDFVGYQPKSEKKTGKKK